MVIISLDMKGLSHAMMAMFCVNDHKDIGQLRGRVIDNFALLHSFRIIQVVKIMMQY